MADILLTPGLAVADVLNMPYGQTSLEFVTVGNPGNPGELSSPQSVNAYEDEELGLDRICGSVGYVYQIGKYEVTNAQYCEFLNAVAASDDPHGLYNTEMGRTTFVEGSGITRNFVADGRTYSLMPGRANKPVKFVSFWDACRFANWLHNGQGNGDTETGAYTLTPEGIADNTVTRNAGWRFAVTSEDEWYKAAYHKNDGPTGNYWDYPTGSDTPPRAEAPPGTDMINGSANWDSEVWSDWGEEEIDVGAYTAKPSSSPYGTFDQGGNAWEWNETASTRQDYGTRGVRGGEASSNAGDNAPGISGLHAMLHLRIRSTGEYNDIGFRVVRAVGGTVVFEDDFSDGVPDGWNEILGTWIVSNDEYVGLVGGYDDTLLAVAGAPDARIMPDFTGSRNDFGLVFYAQNADEYLRFTIGGEPPEPRITHDFDLESVAELATVVNNPAVVQNRWYDVRLILNQDNVSAYVDRQLVAYASSLPFTKGFFGLMADDPVVHFDDILVTAGSNVFFPDYMPLDPSEHGVKTFEWTYGRTGEYDSEIGGDETVPYGSGPVTGATIINHGDWGTMIVSNDGTCVKFLAGGEWYLSTDTSLSAHPPGYALASLCDGMIIEQGEHYNVKKDLSNWERVDDQMLLIDIQEVTVLQGHHVDAVVIWYLDTSLAFTPIDFHGKELELGLTLPASLDTAGYAPTAVEIYALATGLIAQGDIDAATGSLNDLCELKEIAHAYVVEGFENGFQDHAWKFLGWPQWSATREYAYSGSYSARSGEIGDNESTRMTLQHQSASGEVGYWRKVSSESGWDCFVFKLNGREMERVSGEKDWEYASFPVQAGTNNYEFIYEKDSSSSSGLDAVYIDDMKLP
jgi:formylglycine-generating enzyme required for sulfatase activity